MNYFWIPGKSNANSVVYSAPLTLFLSLALSLAKAQVLSLQQCQEYAIRHSLDIRQGELRVETDRLTQLQTERAAWPTLAGSLSEGLNFGRTIDPFSNGFVQQTIHSGSVGLNSNWNLFSGFRQQHQLRQQAFARQADEADVLRQRQEIRQRVIAAYIQVLLSQELLTLAQEQQRTVLKQFDRTRALIREGQLSNTQLTDWEAQLATADYELVNAQATLRQHRMALLRLLNWQETSPLTIRAIEVPTPTTPPTDAQLADLLRQGVLGQPLVQAADWRLKSAKAAAEVLRAGLLPNVSLGAGVNTAYSSAAPPELFSLARQLQYNLGQYVRLSVSLPILNGQQARLQVAKGLIAQQVAAIDVQRSRLQLSQDIEQAFTALILSFEKWQSTRRQVEAQQKALLSGSARFDEGLIHVVEYAALQLNLNRALSNQLQARYEYHFRKLLLDLYNK